MLFNAMLEAAIYALLNTPCEDDPSVSDRAHAIANKLGDYVDAKVTVDFEPEE